METPELAPEDLIMERLFKNKYGLNATDLLMDHGWEANYLRLWLYGETGSGFRMYDI